MTDDITPTTVISKDGTSIAVYRTGTGPALVIVYGALADATYWTTLLPFLRERFTLHLVERRGRGASGNTQPYAVAREVEDVAAAIEAASVDAYVFGHSSGAILALLAAATSNNVRRLALYEPPVVLAGERSPIEDDLTSRLEALVSAGDREGAASTFLREAPGVTEDELAKLRAGRRWPDYLRLANTTPYDARVVAENGLDRLAATALALPTLLLSGEASPRLMIAGVEALARRLPQARLETLTEHGHAAVFTGPALLAESISRFFEAP